MSYPIQILSTAQPEVNDAQILWPWQWESVHWWSWSAVTHAAGQPDVTPAPSAEWKCKRGRWQCRAARSKRRKGRRCKTKLKARGWAHASQCSRLCRKVQDCNVPTVPGALQQTQMHNTTLQPPGGGHGSRRTCYLIRQETEKRIICCCCGHFYPQTSRSLWCVIYSPWLGKQTLRQHTKERAVRLVKLHRPNSTPHIA